MGKNVPWLALFDAGNTLDFEMVGWPVDIPPPIRDGKTSFAVYDGSDNLSRVVEAFQNEDIYFRIKTDGDEDYTNSDSNDDGNDENDGNDHNDI